MLLFSLLLPLLAYSHELVGCQFLKTGAGWEAGAWASGTVTSDGQKFGSGLFNETAGFCNLTHLTENPGTLRVELAFAHAKSGLDYTRGCQFSGKDVTVERTEKVLGMNDFVVQEFEVEVGHPMRNTVVLTTFAGHEGFDWELDVCNEIAKKFPN